MKLLQQALTVLPQLEKLHDVSAVRRTRNTSKETMSLQCVIQKTLTHRCMQLHFTKLLQQALFVLSKRAVSATLYIWWHACYNLSLSLAKSKKSQKRGKYTQETYQLHSWWTVSMLLLLFFKTSALLLSSSSQQNHSLHTTQIARSIELEFPVLPGASHSRLARAHDQFVFWRLWLCRVVSLDGSLSLFQRWRCRSGWGTRNRETGKSFFRCLWEIFLALLVAKFIRFGS